MLWLGALPVAQRECEGIIRAAALNFTYKGRIGDNFVGDVNVPETRVSQSQG